MLNLVQTLTIATFLHKTGKEGTSRCLDLPGGYFMKISELSIDDQVGDALTIVYGTLFPEFNLDIRKREKEWGREKK